MQAAAPAPRHRVYTAVEPRCEWARTADADTLVVDVSGFMKEELRVLYNTSRKLKVAGERPVGDGARWARFLKSFPVPKGVRTGGIRAVMDKEQAVLYVILPKGSPPPPGPPPPPPPPPSSMATQKQKEQQPGGALPPPHGEQKGDGLSGSSSNGSFWSAQEDAEKNRAEEKNNMVPKETRIQIQEEEEIATPDAPRNDGGDGDKRWWEKLRPLHVVGFVVIVLAVVGIGALYAMLLL